MSPFSSHIVLTSVVCCTIEARLSRCNSSRRSSTCAKAHKNNRRAFYRAIGFDPVTVRIEILDRVERLPQRSPGPLKITCAHAAAYLPLYLLEPELAAPKRLVIEMYQ